MLTEMENCVERNTDLIEAVLSGDAESVKILLGGGADINARRHDGKSSLNVASWWGLTDKVRILLDHGADIESRDNEGRTPLCNAVLGKHHDVVTLLVECGAVIDTQENNGRSPLMIACHSGMLGTVRLLLTRGSQVNLCDINGITPLNYASYAGHVIIVEQLLAAGADVNLTTNNDVSCLLAAAFKGHTDVVRALVSAGADVNLLNNDRLFPLTVASHGGHNDCVKLLIESGAEVETRTNEGHTPLHLAASEGHIEIVQFLTEQHADVNACDSEGQSCLWLAAFDGHIDVVRALVSAGADVNLQKNTGFPPLTVASQEGHTDCVKVLVESGAEVEKRTNNGDTPLYWAASEGHIEVVQFLIEQHADVDACDSEGCSCLWTAAFNGHIDVVRALVSAGADVNLQKNFGFSPIGAASQEGHIDSVKLLVESGAEVETRTNDGETPLFCAANKGHIEVIQFLTEQHADVNACDSHGDTCLLESAYYGHTDVVHALVSAGADADLQDPLFYVTASVKCVVKTMLLLLMNKGVCISHMKDCDDKTAPMYMVYGVDNVNMFVECGADIHARNVDNLQAIDIASYCGHVDFLGFLCDCLPCIKSLNKLEHFHFYSISASCPVSSIGTDHNCNTAVHQSTDIQCMRSLLENGAHVEAENADGLQPIHCAVRTGLFELVEMLIQHGANVDAADVHGNRPLHDAVCHGLNVVQSLVHHGAKVNVQNVDGKTPLHVAIERQQSEAVKFLVNAGADVGLTDVWRNTPLHYLTAGQLKFGELEECAVTQRKKYQHLLIRNAVGVNALSSMAAHGILDYADCQPKISNADRVSTQENTHSEQLTHVSSSSAIPCLLELQQINTFSKTKVYSRKESADVDCYGNTPVHYAVGVYAHLKLYRISTEVKNTVEFLVKRGADVNAKNNDGRTPLHVARGKEAIEACIQYADDHSFTVPDIRGRNFWHLLFLFGSQSEIAFATNVPPTVFASNAKYNIDDLNKTPLHYACMQRNTWITKRPWLTEKIVQEFSDIHINKQHNFGRTALHYAAMAGNTEVMDLLKTKKADDMVQDNFENTADEYEGICNDYEAKISLLQLVNTSSFVLRNLHLILLGIQQHFSHSHLNVNSSNVELRKIICDLQADNAPSYVLNIYKGCCLDYSNVCRKQAALTHRFHESVELLANVNESAKQLPTMFEAIQSQVEKAVQHLAEEISVKDTRFACESFLVGSAREGIKIGCCDEFDYNFVLTDLSGICTVCYSSKSPPGFVLLKASTLEYDEDLFDSNGILNTRIVKFKYETLVKQILSSLSFCDATGFEFIDPVQDFFVPPGISSKKVNTQIKLEFTKPVNGYHVPHSISVDVVPALHINGWWPDDMHRKDLCQAG